MGHVKLHRLLVWPVSLILGMFLCLSDAMEPVTDTAVDCPPDCSWTAYEAGTQEEESFQCSITSSVSSYSCPQMVISHPHSVAERPKEVSDLETEYYTRNISTEDGSFAQQICLRVHFTLDPSTASNIEGIEVSLHSRDYWTYGDALCRQFQFPGHLTYCSVLNGNCDHRQKRVFSTGCFCDLYPAGTYHLIVKTLPEDQLTETRYSARVTRTLTVPDCSVYPLDQMCPRGLSLWRPSYSKSEQEADYTSMTTCFTLPPPDAENFFAFLYSDEPRSSARYTLVQDLLLNRTEVVQQTKMINGKHYILACIRFSGLRTNMTYLPAVRLEPTEKTDDPPRLQYLNKSRLFLIDNPCDAKPCGDLEDGICLANGSSYECICNEGAIFNGAKCRRDIEDPQVLNCPSTLTVPSEPGNCTASVTWPPINASDNSGYFRLVYKSHQAGDSFDVGVTQVVYTFADVANNTASCLFEVKVIDQEAPIVAPCIHPIRAALEVGETHVELDWDIWAKDNCGVVTSNIPLKRSQLFSSGVTDIPITIQDQSGNQRNCSVTVEIDAAPFNYMRPVYIVGALIAVAVLIVAVLWRYRSKLRAFKAFLKSHHPYSFSVEGSLPSPSLHGATPTPRDDRIDRWLHQRAVSSSVPETLSQEDAISDHLRFEPAVLLGRGYHHLMKEDEARNLPSDEEIEHSKESDNLFRSEDACTKTESDLATSRL